MSIIAATETLHITPPNLFTNDRKLPRGLVFVRRCNAKPAGIRVALAPANKALKIKAKATMFSLEGKSFDAQYLRAIAALANFHGIELDDPIRDELAATKGEFLVRFGLKTKTVTVTYDQVVFAEKDEA
jgi:hypothetical protein